MPVISKLYYLSPLSSRCNGTFSDLRSALLQSCEDVDKWAIGSFDILKLIPEHDAEATEQTIMDLIAKLKQSAHPVKKKKIQHKINFLIILIIGLLKNVISNFFLISNTRPDKKCNCNVRSNNQNVRL
jgi:hypothetical protein